MPKKVIRGRMSYAASMELCGTESLVSFFINIFNKILYIYFYVSIRSRNLISLMGLLLEKLYQKFIGDIKMSKDKYRCVLCKMIKVKKLIQGKTINILIAYLSLGKWSPSR